MELISLVSLGLGVSMTVAAVTIVASGCHRMRSLTRENISLREENIHLCSKDKIIWQEYMRVCRENQTLNATRGGVDLENSVLRDQLREKVRVQELLREKVRALAQDPVSSAGRTKVSKISGNEIEVIEVQVDPYLIPSPMEPPLFQLPEFLDSGFLLMIWFLTSLGILIRKYWLFSPSILFHGMLLVISGTRLFKARATE